MLCTHSYYETPKAGVCYRQSTQQLHQVSTSPSAALPTAHPLLAEAISMLPYLASTAGVRLCLYELLGLVLVADPKSYI